MGKKGEDDQDSDDDISITEEEEESKDAAEMTKFTVVNEPFKQTTDQQR